MDPQQPSSATPHPGMAAHAAADRAVTGGDSMDHSAMDRAVAAALEGVRGANPLVGAVLTGPDGRVLSVGRHRGAGTPHAESDALAGWARLREQDADASAIDPSACTLHVTLEPCDHTGRTGPCSAAVRNAGIGRLIYAVADPTGTSGGGAATLRSAGVEVLGPTGHPGAVALTERWCRARAAGRPFVTAHLAQSLDGCAAAADGTSRWITSPQSRAHAHAVRGRVDAIVVGTGTVLADDPRLTVRHDGGSLADAQPVPVVMGHRDVPAAAALRRHPALAAGQEPMHVRSHVPADVLEAIAHRPGPWPHGRGGCEHLLVEGGPTVLAAWIAADLVDELHVYTAPTFLGPGLSAVAGLGVATLADAVRWAPDRAEGGPVRPFGPDTWTHLQPATAAGKE